MINLEKLVCSNISDEAREVYTSLDSNNDDGRFVNTTFQLVVEPQENLKLSLIDTFMKL